MEEYDDSDVRTRLEPHSYRNKVKMSRRKFLLLMILGPLIALLIGILIGYSTRPSNEPSSSEQGSQSNGAITNMLLAEMKPSNIRENLKTLSEKVHDAGSSQEVDTLVDFMVGKWREQLDDVKVYPYNVMLSYPNDTDPNYVAVIDEESKVYDKSAGFEPALDPSEDFSKIHASYNSYGQAGHVEGQLVYVNYARYGDFEKLNKTLGVDVKGKICISRYGRIFRGDKAEYAEMSGCLGLIIFTDPADYGNKDDINDTFPNSWWMPHTGVQRGSLYMTNGDPQSPQYPSMNYTYRVPENESGLPNIPVQPISSDDAYKYLSKIGGQKAPDDWQGGMNISYNIGGEMKPEFQGHKIQLHVMNSRPVKEIKNIVGIIKGASEPDRHVIIGNHRDAWVFGALDPSSGTAVMMEIARAMGKLVKEGKWRPRRTIMFCSWDAEEFGLIGSVEWTEEFEKKLLLEAVTYLNVDIAVQGTTTFRAKATPNLRRALYQVAKMVPNPDQKEIDKNRPYVYDTWKLKYSDKNNKSRPAVKALGSGSDFASFLQKTGVSCVDVRYTYDEINLRLSSYPIYHSAHETISYFEKFLDPEYKYSLAVGQMWGELARMIADEKVIPFDCVDYATEIKVMISQIDSKYKELLGQHDIELNALHESVSILLTSANKLNESIARVNLSNSLALRDLNDKIMLFERGFLDFNGLPGRGYLRHIVYAPSVQDSYAGVGFSGFVDAIEQAKKNGNWELVKQQLSVITFHLRSAASILEPSF